MCCVCVSSSNMLITFSKIAAGIVWVRELNLCSHNTYTCSKEIASTRSLYVLPFSMKKPLACACIAQAHVLFILVQSSLNMTYILFSDRQMHNVRNKMKNDFWYCLITHLNRNTESKVPKNLKEKISFGLC